MSLMKTFLIKSETKLNITITYQIVVKQFRIRGNVIDRSSVFRLVNKT